MDSISQFESIQSKEIMKKDLNKPVSRARHFSEAAFRGSETIVENLAKYFLNARTVGIKFGTSFQN